jgi:hypothetical protein
MAQHHGSVTPYREKESRCAGGSGAHAIDI